MFHHQRLGLFPVSHLHGAEQDQKSSWSSEGPDQHRPSKSWQQQLLADLDVAIVKATRHEEYPAEERHIREILSLTCYSRAFVSACVNTLARRLNKTKNWTVALKTLMLIHRLLADGDPSYEQEIFFSTRRGTRILNMSDFRDHSSQSNSWDYSAFVRTYALYLDERLEFRMQGKRGKRSAFEYEEDEEEGSAAAQARNTPVCDMKTVDIFSRINHLQQLLERFLACRPTGEAKSNRVVLVALYPIVKESFQIYYDITEIMGILIERFMELEVQDCVKVHEIFYRVLKQFDELDSFYTWCRSTGIARSSEYPEVEKIALKKLDLMDEFIRDKAALAQSRKNRIVGPEEPVVEAKEPEPVEENINAIKALPAPEGWEVRWRKKRRSPRKRRRRRRRRLISKSSGSSLGSLHNRRCSRLGNSPGPIRKRFVSAEDQLRRRFRHVVAGRHVSASNNGRKRQREERLEPAEALAAWLWIDWKAAMLALPAPPTSNDGASTRSVDPFAASLAVAPPTYVQMSEMEKKQKLLMEEQFSVATVCKGWDARTSWNSKVSRKSVQQWRIHTQLLKRNLGQL
ncbi:putative clathrin assembly protein [Vitis vinifera]|uniref:Putative clathrin assembly protein n=1 Tax=Vitis vinifera TaxID=29760 RepID=A0A438J0M7_VITVI|nr:putative clathrin assembly protein [Vitis vinifera]